MNDGLLGDWIHLDETWCLAFQLYDGCWYVPNFLAVIIPQNLPLLTNFLTRTTTFTVLPSRLPMLDGSGAAASRARRDGADAVEVYGISGVVRARVTRRFIREAISFINVVAVCKDCCERCRRLTHIQVNVVARGKTRRGAATEM